MKKKTLNGLRKHFGVLKISEEDKKIKKEIKEGWARWRKRLTREINNE